MKFFRNKHWRIVGMTVMAIVFVGFVLLRQLEGLALYPRSEPDTQFQVTPGTLWEIETDDVNGPVYAIYLEARKRRPTVVTFHGNGQQLVAMLPWLSLLEQRGFGALLVEYPGYGLAHSQEPDEQAIYRDADFAIQHLMSNHGVANSDIVLLGESLGTGVAMEMASRGMGSRVVLLSAFTSIPDLSELHVPWHPLPSILINRYNSLAKTNSVSQPVLLIHGTADTLVPVAMGEALANRLPHGHLVQWEGVAHGGMIAIHGARVLATLENWMGQD